MRKYRLILLCLVCLFSASALAESRAADFDATRSANQAIDLTDGWRVHTGDNPTWAKTDFDDHGWLSTTLEADATTIQPGWRWYRIRVQLPSEHPPLALLVVGPTNAYQVYVNGSALAGPQILSPLHVYLGRERIVPLEQERGGTMEIALRVFYPPSYTKIYGIVLNRVVLGPVSVIRYQSDLAQDTRLLWLLPSTAINLALIFAGCGAMLLFLLQRGAYEYLWLGLTLFLAGESTAAFWMGTAGAIPLSVNGFVGDPIGYPIIVFQIEFIFAFSRRRVTLPWRIYQAVLLAFVLLSMLTTFSVLPPLQYLLTEALVNTSAAVLLPCLLFAWYVKGNREAGWLILPMLLPAVGTVIGDLGLVSPSLGWTQMALLGQPISIGPIRFNLQDLLAGLVFLLSIGIVMAIRFTRLSRERARTAAELDAAREIQQRLVPAILPETGAYRVEAAYLPAQEVGGDFYLVLHQANGTLLVLVGDVSGKGLKAAMTGVLAIGAARTLASEGLEPGKLLARLNNEMAGSQNGGFITCLCAAISPGGSVLIANAGHLAPYRAGKEIELENGLPLGIVRDNDYPETTIQLQVGDKLTLLSDGVVEAQNQQRELFGFDRTRQISGNSAHAIAEAAQHFGQEDDITVLTLVFTGHAVVLP